jgi:hypothetical protein
VAFSFGHLTLLLDSPKEVTDITLSW